MSIKEGRISAQANVEYWAGSHASHSLALRQSIEGSPSQERAEHAAAHAQTQLDQAWEQLFENEAGSDTTPTG